MAHLQLLLPHLDDGILGMELPVCAFEGLGHSLDPLNNVQAGDEIPVQLAGITDDTDDRGVVSGGDMGPQVLRLNPVNQILYTLLFCALLHNDNHSNSFLSCGFPRPHHRPQKRPAVKCFSPQAFDSIPFLTQRWSHHYLQQKALLPCQH